jgi:hypothetical protein
MNKFVPIAERKKRKIIPILSPNFQKKVNRIEFINKELIRDLERIKNYIF